MKPVRVGVVGLGMVAQIMHLPYLHEMEEFEIAAVCDVSAKLVDKVAGQYGVSGRFTDYRRMIASGGVDVVMVLTFYHSDIVRAACAAGKHIFCEKPVAFSPKEAEEMLRAVEKAGVLFQIGYMKRYDEGYLLGLKYFKEMKKAGDLRLIRVHDACFQNDLAIGSMYRLWKFDDVPASAMREGGRLMAMRTEEALGKVPANVASAYRLLLETGSHDVNVLRGAFGGPNHIVSTEIWPRGNWFTSVMDYGGEVRCELTVARTARNWGDESITAYGMTRTAGVHFPNPFHKNAPTTVEVISMDGAATSREVISASHSEAFHNELVHLADCVRRKKKPLTSLEDGLEDTRLMAAIIKKSMGKK